MFPSKVANAHARRAAAVLAPVLALLAACSRVKEWDERPGTLALYATPLPPIAGQPLTLGIVGTNIGPVDVFQGDERVASLVNVDTTSRVDVQVVAVSSAVPRAVAVAFDYERLEVEAALFTTPPKLPDGGAVDAGSADTGAPADARPPFIEDCPGLTPLAAPSVCNAPTSDTLSVDVRNDRPATATARFYFAPDGGSCERVAGTGLFPANDRIQVDMPRGSTVEFVDRTTSTVFRTVTLPMQGPCSLLLAP